MAFDIKRSAARSGIAAIAMAITCGIALTSSAYAQGVSGRCARDPGAETSLDLVRSADNEKARAVAASTLIKDWRTSLPTVMRELSKTSGPVDRWRPDQSSMFLSISDILRTILSADVQAITLFRNCDVPSMIKPLIWAARSDNQGLRLNATLILGNTIDNTTVCFVLHHLRDPRINSNGRANLLGVTFAVAGYAYSENVAAIEKTLELLRPKVEASMTQTQKLMADVSTRAQASPNKSTPLAQVGLAEPCAAYPYQTDPD